MQHLFRKLNHFSATLNGVLVGISLSAALGVSPEVLAAAATDVKCRGCVENADVRNGSIGTAKLRNFSVTTAKLAPNAVTAAKLRNGVVTTEKLAPNAVTSSNILNGAVTGGKLANGAVTSLNIANGTVTAEKLAPGMLTKPNNVIHVANDGGDFTDPEQAVSSITDASPSNRYLVVIAPGEYEGSPLSTQPYIDVAGSGEHNTIIKTNASVYVAPNSELRDLTIENVNNSFANKAVALNMDNGSPRLTRVTVTIAASNTDKAYAIYGTNASPVMNHVTAVASGAAVSTAIYADTSSSAVPLIMNDTTAIATGGDNSTAVEAPAKYAILTRVIFTASNAQNENIALKTESCCGNLTITDMTATSTGGSKASAFYANGGSPRSSLTLTRSTLKAAASGQNVGLDIQKYNAMVSHSTIVGTANIDTGTKCVFVDDGIGHQLNIICTL